MTGTKKIAAALVPIAFIGAAGIAVKMIAGKRDGLITEQTRAAVRDALRNIETAVTKLKSDIEGKSAVQLRRTVDSAVEITKRKLDQLATEVKNRIRTSAEKA